MAEYYLLTKAIHLVAVISWMAAMLYLPRLFVYHSEVPLDSGRYQMLLVMERRLIKAIMTPAMIVSLLLGLLLIHIVGVKGLGGWFHFKALLLIILFGLHGYFIRCYKAFLHEKSPHTTRFFRMINEVVTFCMVIIVVLAVLKPW